MIEPPLSDCPTNHEKIRLWPTAIVVMIQLGLLFLCVTPSIDNGIRFVCLIAGPLVCFLLFSIALVFFSRIRAWVSLPVLLAIVLMGVLAFRISAPRTEIACLMYGVPFAIVLTFVGLCVSQSSAPNRQLLTICGLSALGWAGLSLIRLDGVDGSYVPAVTFRWIPTTEERLVNSQSVGLKGQTDRSRTEEWVIDSEEWPGFRGRDRNARVVESLPEQDWESRPPKELWRRAIGPGWSSLSLISGRLFTQEQRGDDEAVSCYDASTGEPVWVHTEPSRFEEVVSGAGPRATPTYAAGRIFAYGAKGLLVALEASTGKLIWKRDLLTETKAEVPIWGFSSSPAVFDETVVVYAGGSNENGLVGLDYSTGQTRWGLASRGMNFASAQPISIGGESMLLFVEANQARGIDPLSGEVLWQYPMANSGNPSIVQPQQISDDTIVIPLSDERGLAAIRLEKQSDGTWVSCEIWNSRNLKPSFNDFVYQNGVIFGFDKEIFAAIDAGTGQRLWKRGRYGFGQVISLESSRQLVVTTERGDAVLVDARREGLVERGRVKCFSGKTWNHPIIVDGKLYARNSEEFVCLLLSGRKISE
jgi:outer membrane protein assembly factor BamB